MEIEIKKTDGTVIGKFPVEPIVEAIKALLPSEKAELSDGKAILSDEEKTAMLNEAAGNLTKENWMELGRRLGYVEDVKDYAHAEETPIEKNDSILASPLLVKYIKVAKE